ncbi:SapC family protein [Sphingomonas sp. I4]
MGLVPEENLCLGPQRTLTGYRPADLERQAFYVSGENIAIDPRHPALGQPDGAALFEADGGAAPRCGVSRVHCGRSIPACRKPRASSHG